MADIWMKVRGCCNARIGQVFEVMDEIEMPPHCELNCGCGIITHGPMRVLMFAERKNTSPQRYCDGLWVPRDWCVKLPPLEEDSLTPQDVDIEVTA